MKLENKYFLNIIKKISILAFFYFVSFLSFLSNKKGSNNILLKDYLPLELPNIWSLIIPRNLALKLS
jgi:hypothetical protein